MVHGNGLSAGRPVARRPQYCNIAILQYIVCLLSLQKFGRKRRLVRPFSAALAVPLVPPTAQGVAAAAMAAEQDRFNVNISFSKNWDHLQTKNVGTGHPDITKLCVAEKWRRPSLRPCNLAGSCVAAVWRHFCVRERPLLHALNNFLCPIVCAFPPGRSCCSEWAVNHHRDSIASHIGHSDMLAYFGVVRFRATVAQCGDCDVES
jgi:hypothetical protein